MAPYFPYRIAAIVRRHTFLIELDSVFEAWLNVTMLARTYPKFAHDYSDDEWEVLQDI